MEIWRQRNQATTIYFPLVDRGTLDFEATPVTFAAGDTQFSVDGGTFANTTNNPAHEGNGIYSLVLTAGEVNGQNTVITLIDSATKAWEDQAIVISTYGDSSAEHAVNLNDSVRAGLTALPNAAAEAAGGLYTRGTGAGQINQPANGQVDANVAALTNDIITAAKIADGAIDAATFAAGAINAAAIATDAIGSAEFAQAAADKVWSSATRNLTALGFTLAETDFSAAALRQLGRLLFSGTASAAGTTTTVVDSSLTETDDIWTGGWILFTGGTPDIANQCRLITDFDAASDTITFAPAVKAATDATTTFEIYAYGGADVQSWLGLNAAMAAPNALVSGRVDSSAGAIAANAITATAIAANAITAAKVADGTIDAATFAANAITAAVIAAGAVDADALATDAVNEIARAILPQTNQALSNLEFLMVDNTDHVTPETGLTVTGQRSIDGGAFVAVSGTIAEVGNGIYQFDAAAADVNGTIITFRFSATGADDTFLTVRMAA